MPKKKRVKKSSGDSDQRIEALLRLVAFIVTGIILQIWAYIVIAVAAIHFIMALMTGEKFNSLALFCEYFNLELNRFAQYITFVSDERPFPFSSLKKPGKIK